MDLLDSLPRLVKPGGTFDADRATAYHEMGHCLIILRHGYYPSRVTLDPPGTYFRYRGIAPNFALMLHMGGPAAQAIYSGIYGWSEGDRRHLKRVMSRHNISSLELVRVWAETHVELLNHWEWVALMASRLYDNKELDKRYFTNLMT